jgi:hypothetical protein
MITMKIELGNVAEWVGAVGTIAVFIGGLLLVFNDRRARELQAREERWDQALLVTTSSEIYTAEYSKSIGKEKYHHGGINVHNAGKRPIFGCIVTVTAAAFAPDSDSLIDSRYVHAKDRIGRIEPRATGYYVIQSEYKLQSFDDKTLSVDVVVEWQDVSGTNWLLDTSGELLRDIKLDDESDDGAVSTRTTRRFPGTGRRRRR